MTRAVGIERERPTRASTQSNRRSDVGSGREPTSSRHSVVTPATKPATSSIGSALTQVRGLQVLVELGQHILGDAARLDDSIPGMPESLAPFTAGAACP